jgi:hypothetical protein
MLVPNVLVPKLSAKGSHVWSLRMLALIVRSFADLWTPLQDLVGLWTTSGVAETLACDGGNVLDSHRLC